MILITGATGQLGGVVIEKLLENIDPSKIAVLVRDEDKAADLKAKGLDIRIGNYHDVVSLQSAMQGIEKVLLISSNDFNDRLGQHKNVIDAAQNAGVKHILYTGVAMNDIENSPLKPILSDHFQTEDYIKNSGLNYTFLRNSLYAEVVPMFLGANVLQTGVFFPAGDGKVAFAVRKDLGEATANILLGDGHENKIYDLTGSEVYSFEQIAAELSNISQKQVTYISPEPQVFEETLKQFGLPNEIILVSTLFAAGIKNNDFNQASETLSQLLGRKTTTMDSFLKSTFSA